MVTKPVTIKAMVRVCADLAREDAEPEAGRVARWEAAPRRLDRDGASQFREEGFYERFPAKGEVERVARVHRDLAAPRASRSSSAGNCRAAAPVRRYMKIRPVAFTCLTPAGCASTMDAAASAAARTGTTSASGDGLFGMQRMDVAPTRLSECAQARREARPARPTPRAGRRASGNSMQRKRARR